MLLPILGLTWVFGLLAVNSATIVFQYLFTVFNSFQGLFIFLINCAFNSEVSDLVVITPDRDPYKFLFFWINLATSWIFCVVYSGSVGDFGDRNVFLDLLLKSCVKILKTVGGVAF